MTILERPYGRYFLRWNPVLVARVIQIKRQNEGEARRASLS